MVVQVTNEQVTPHHQLLTKHRRSEMYIENLVLDVQIAGITGNDRSHHLSPSRAP